MPRSRTLLQSKYPYHITARCINREWFSLEMGTVWKIFSEELYLVNAFHKLKIHAFILMSNHFHLIASTPLANLDVCMLRFMKNTSQRLTQSGNRINGTFAGRYKKTILNDPSYFLNAYKYLYQNSIRAGVAERAENYPYSTLHGLVGKSKLIIPLVADDTFFSAPEQTLNWLNSTPESRKLEAVKIGLKKPYFRSTKCTASNRPVLLQDELI